MKHDYSISVMRVFAMLMIVYYHCLCYNLGVWGWFGNSSSMYSPLESAFMRNISYVGLDAFVFISGLLYYRIGSTGKYDNIKCFVIGKADRLLIPYLVWGILQCILFYGFERPSNIFYGSEHLWFLLMLFEIFTLAALTKDIWGKLRLKTSILFLIFLLFQDWVVNKLNLLPRDEYGRSLLCIQSTLKYLPMFYMGIATEQSQIYKKFQINRKLGLSIVIILFSVGALLNFIHLPLLQAYLWIPTYFMMILCYGALRNFGKMNAPTGGGEGAKASLQILDRYSLSIYIIHHVLIWFALFYLPDINAIMKKNYIVAPIIMFSILVPLSLGIAIILSYMPYAKYIIGVNRSY